MAPTTEKAPRRRFSLRLKDVTVTVTADTICEPESGGNGYYVLKRAGEKVGKFDHQDVSGWWLEEDDGA